jgi:trimethylamine:corrinoid methyltransferase-like protein
MERQSNNNNPFGIWQSIWADQIKLFNEQMIEATTSDQPHNNYKVAYTALTALNKEIPSDCQSECNSKFEEATLIMNKPRQGHDFVAKEKHKRSQINTEAPSALWAAMGEIIRSLHKNGWINKPDFSAQPKYEKKGHI